MRSQLSFEPHPFIRPPSRSRVYLCPFRGPIRKGDTITDIGTDIHHKHMKIKNILLRKYWIAFATIFFQYDGDIVIVNGDIVI